MISIIVCSVQQSAFAAFEENIKATIGVPFEIVRIDNSNNAYSICNAYNIGVSRSKYNYVCFSHEDIILRTQNWGRKVIETFESCPTLGLLGIAGSTYKAYAPSGWGIVPQLRYVNLIQHYKSSHLTTRHDYQNPDSEKLSKVVCIDGVWMCTKREIAIKHKFDQQTFNGFHCYDLDLCLSMFKTYDVAVTFEILLEHFSEGKNDSGWVTETMKLHKKWKSILPVNIATIENAILQKYELDTLKYFLSKMIESGFSSWQVFLMLTYNNDNEHISRKDLDRIKFDIIKTHFKAKLSSLYHYVSGNRVST